MTPRPRVPLRSALRAGLAVGRRPGLWPTAVRQTGVLAAPGWWRRRPFLPLPSPEYLRFRLQTAYGGSGPWPIEPDDVVSYLEWCRDTRRELRRRPSFHRRSFHRQSAVARTARPVP